jgi:hypothetical protein
MYVGATLAHSAWSRRVVKVVATAVSDEMRVVQMIAERGVSHAGLAIAGDIGYASRLQALTKSLGCEVLMSEEVYARAGFAADDLSAHEVEVGGRNAFVKAKNRRQSGRPRDLRSGSSDSGAMIGARLRARFGR